MQLSMSGNMKLTNGRFCNGCLVQDGERPLDTATTTLAIEWDARALHLFYDFEEETAFDEHDSVREHFKKKEAALDLETCLRAFTQEELLGADETWYCPKCQVPHVGFGCRAADIPTQKHQAAAKKLDIWSLPPFLIIHLKRFQSVNGGWRKSHREVRFPIEGFDPKPLSSFTVRLRIGYDIAHAPQHAATTPPPDAGTPDKPQAAVEAKEPTSPEAVTEVAQQLSEPHAVCGGTDAPLRVTTAGVLCRSRHAARVRPVRHVGLSPMLLAMSVE